MSADLPSGVVDETAIAHAVRYADGCGYDALHGALLARGRGWLPTVAGVILARSGDPAEAAAHTAVDVVLHLAAAVQTGGNTATELYLDALALADRLVRLV